MKEYTVGRGRPPKEHQFKPGHSGNPGGRPRKRGNSDALSILDEPVTIVQDGTVRTLSPREVTLRRMLKKAIGDDVLSAIIYLLDTFDRHGLLAPPPETAGGVLTLPCSMPLSMAVTMAERFGAPPWNEAQTAVGREIYLADRSEGQRLKDDAIGYPDL